MAVMGRRAKVVRLPVGPRPPARSALPGEPEPAELTEVSRCRDQAEALVVRALLESGGIAAVLRGRLVQSLHPFSVGDQAEITVLVAAADAEAARRLLARR
jgi:hypothetical protein